MKRSTDRILTTHVGSLIRPPALQQFLRAKQAGEPFDQKAYESCLAQSVADIVRRQAQAGIDVISDGEFGKAFSWSQYVLERLSGFERRPIEPGANPFTRGADRERFSEFYAELDAREGLSTQTDSVCVGPIAYTGQAALQRDIENFKAALKNVQVEEAFLPVPRRRASFQTARTNTTGATRNACSRSPRPCGPSTARSSRPVFSSSSTMPARL